MWDIVGKRYLWFAISLMIIVPGLLALHRLRLSVSH